MVQALLLVQQIVGNVQRGHYRYAVGTDDFSAGTDLAHLAVEITGGAFQVGTFLGGTGDAIFLVEDLDVDGVRLAHESCSRAFRRKIIASTLCRANSFFSIR
ncbi:hypothetical protein D3C81_943400 [compost metagenome]